MAALAVLKDENNLSEQEINNLLKQGKLDRLTMEQITGRPAAEVIDRKVYSYTAEKIDFSPKRFLQQTFNKLVKL